MLAQTNPAAVASDPTNVGSCDLARVVEHIQRDEIRLVKRHPEGHGSKKATIIGLVAGGLFGAAFSLGNALSCDIRVHPTSCAVGTAAVLWMPAAGGALGYGLTWRVDEDVYYSRTDE